jgi:hypothetical protein
MAASPSGIPLATDSGEGNDRAETSPSSLLAAQGKSTSAHGSLRVTLAEQVSAKSRLGLRSAIGALSRAMAGSLGWISRCRSGRRPAAVVPGPELRP